MPVLSSYEERVVRVSGTSAGVEEGFAGVEARCGSRALWAVRAAGQSATAGTGRDDVPWE